MVSVLQERNKFVMFELEREMYGISLLQIQEIIADFHLTVFPNLPQYFSGVLSLRGQAIPLMNLRRRFGFEERERKRHNRVIIIELKPNPIGILVDRVARVTSIAAEQVVPPPAMTQGKRSEFITGVTPLEDHKFMILLDMQKIVSSVEQLHLQEFQSYIQNELSSPSADEAEVIALQNEEDAFSEETEEEAQLEHAGDEMVSDTSAPSDESAEVIQ